MPARIPWPPIARRDLLLLRFAQRRTSKAPHQLDIDDLDAPLIGALRGHLQTERGASVRTRNARLIAIRSLFRFAAYRRPESAAVIQRVLAIPSKRTNRSLITYLTDAEVRALLAAPDRSTRIGRRDHALLLLALETGLRVSELTALPLRRRPSRRRRARALFRQRPQGADQATAPADPTAAASLANRAGRDGR